MITIDQNNPTSLGKFLYYATQDYFEKLKYIPWKPDTDEYKELKDAFDTAMLEQSRRYLRLTPIQLSKTFRIKFPERYL